MIKKIATTIEMSFDIPESEKKEAQAASEEFKKVISTLELAKQHLNLMYEPFKSAEAISPEALNEFRGAIHKYKEQIKENFNNVKAAAFLAIMRLNYFATDTHITELINSFRDSIGDVEKQINILLRILDNLRSSEFKDNFVQGIEAVRKACFEVEKLIKERILDYVDTNILAKDWMTDTGAIKDRVPYITQLFEERQKALENGR